MDRRPLRVPILILTALVSCWTARSAASAPDEPAEPAQPVVATPPIAERVTVVSTRLPDQPEPAERVPSLVTVLDAESIARSGVRTLQDLLAFEVGVSVYDQVGNDIQKTLDLRGYGAGTGTRVWLDGAPINDSKGNGVALELVPLGALERIEVTRGPSAAIGGGGAVGGVIRLSSRHAGEGLGGNVSLAAGSFGTTELGGGLHGTFDRLDFTLSGPSEETDGFRDNAGGDLRRFLGRVGYDLGPDRRIELSVVDGRSALGSPGALTAEEWASDATQAPYNRLDHVDQRNTQVALNFESPLGASVSLAANAFARDRTAESLTTGRAAAAFGGSRLDADESAVGATVQVTHRHVAGSSENLLAFGAEWLDGDTDSVAISTPPGDPGHVDPAATASDNTTGRRTEALFVQDTWRATPRVSLVAALRADSDRVEYAETLPTPGNAGTRMFSEISARASAMYGVSERLGVWATYAEAFLPPTVEELYAFPTFGSNPTLEPEDTQSWEIGLRHAWADGPSLEVAGFVADTDNEIVFDPDSPLGLFGANVNAGKTRRRGIEASAHGTLAPRMRCFANLTLIDASFRNGPDAGKAVPLVPGERLAFGFDLDLPARLRLRADALWVGEQVLDNDAANAQPKLDAYAVANARLTWRAVEGHKAGGLELWAEVRNLFDERYATRGIYAFDFSTFANDAFFTPAPGRRWLAGVEWSF